MKKRSVLVTVLAMVLVAVVSVTGTLAYLTATDGKAVNTFQFANGIKVTLNENWIEENRKEQETAVQNGKGWNYTNLVPGQEVYKAPEFTVTSSVDSYVFARVSGASENVKIGKINENWKAVGTLDNYGNGVYCIKATANAETVDLGALFTTVTIGDVAIDGKPATQETYNLGSIEIEVAAIQQAGFASEVEALKAAVWQK